MHAAESRSKGHAQAAPISRQGLGVWRLLLNKANMLGWSAGLLLQGCKTYDYCSAPGSLLSWLHPWVTCRASLCRVRGDGRQYIASVRCENWLVDQRSHDVWQAFLFAR